MVQLGELRPSEPTEQAPQDPLDVLRRGFALHHPERRHQIPRLGIVLADLLQVQHEIPEARQIPRQRFGYGGDELGDVRGGPPARPAVVDGDGQQGRQPVAPLDVFPADQLLVGETGVSEDAERHGLPVTR